MVQPVKPWPRSGMEDSLSEIIASGDVAQAREHFDRVFWDKLEERPGWKHLRLAVLKEDRAMIKLLATWGAHPTEDELSHFRAVTGEKYNDYVRLMRQGGLRSNGQPWEQILPKANVTETAEDLIVKSFVDNRFAGYTLDKVNKEWLKVLEAFQLAGASEAVIAGGAMRDTFNNREVKDVDIFLRGKGSEKKNRKFMKAVFEAAGIEVHEQVFTYHGEYSTRTTREKFPEPKRDARTAFRDSSLKREREMESWTVIAGKEKTEYNIIFVNDNLDKALANEATKIDGKAIFTGGLLESFDTGISQIATDGREIVSTQAYRTDVANKRITLTRPELTTDDHIKRIMAKYPDFEPSPEIKQMLAPKPAPKPKTRRSSYYY